MRRSNNRSPASAGMEYLAPMGKLTTHVLDLVSGRPANGLEIRVFRVDGDDLPVASAITDDDGRVQRPLVEGADFIKGTYEVRFAVGDYLRRKGHTRPFYEVIPIRISVIEPDEHYHVPLLLSPHGYSTYRGS